MKTMIAIPCMDTVPARFAESLLALDKPEGTSVCFRTNSLIYDARNILSLTGIEQNADYILWLDSDILCPRDTLTRLVSVAEQYGADMVTGLYVKRDGGNTPVLYSQVDVPVLDGGGRPVKRITEYTDWKEDSVFLAKGCGFGCVLTNVRMLKDLWNTYGPPFAPYPWCSEDIAFCYRAAQTGHTLLCDSHVRCGHIGQHIFVPEVMNREEQ